MWSKAKCPNLKSYCPKFPRGHHFKSPRIQEDCTKIFLRKKKENCELKTEEEEWDELIASLKKRNPDGDKSVDDSKPITIDIDGDSESDNKSQHLVYDFHEVFKQIFLLLPIYWTRRSISEKFGKSYKRIKQKVCNAV